MSFAMVTVYNIGQMAHTMKDNGFIIKPRETAPFGMLKVMYIGENSKMIWPMDTANIFTSMEASIKENLKMMFRRAMAKKNGSMVPSM